MSNTGNGYLKFVTIYHDILALIRLKRMNKEKIKLAS